MLLINVGFATIELGLGSFCGLLACRKCFFQDWITNEKWGVATFHSQVCETSNAAQLCS